MTTTTPNMNLVLGDVSLTSGPLWASLLNAALEAIDSHAHVSGEGVLIPTMALNINADLNFNSFNAYGLRTVRLVSQGATPSLAGDINIVYSKNGELTYRDALGNEVGITSGGVIAGASGVISGLVAPATASYSVPAKAFTFNFDASSPARLNIADIALYPYDGITAFTNIVTLKSPTALAASYSITWPLGVPTQANILSMNTGGVLSTGIADGTLAAPSLAFTSDLDTGFYRPSNNLINVACGALPVAQFSSQGIRVENGSVGLAAFSFIDDTDTGFWKTAGNTNIINATCDGTTVGQFSSQGLRVENGSQSLPALAFLNNTDMGIYRAANNVMGLVIAGNRTIRMDALSVSFESGVQIQSENGTAAAPAYSFNGDLDTGVYRPSANTVAVSTGGTSRMTVSSAGINWEAGGAFKVKVFTGTVGQAPATAVLAAPSGIVLGTFGLVQRAAGATWTTIENDEDVTDTNTPHFQASGTSSTTVTLVGSPGAFTNSYRVVMFYQ